MLPRIRADAPPWPHHLFAILAAASLLAGCAGRPLMPTPDLYTVGGTPAFGDLPAELESNRVDILYVTDRKPEENAEGRLTYGTGRSPSGAIGSAIVQIGSDTTTWEDLVADAGSETRTGTLQMTMVSVTELLRTPPTPWPYVMVAGKPVVDQGTLAKVRDVRIELRDEIVRRLALTERKEIVVYVHGIKTSFEEAVFTGAELFHFSGRQGVPIVYTWPAGASGLLTGYTTDRESGEFTIHHLKMFLRALTSIPEVEKVHFLAHSRGTDVLTTALREIFLEGRAAGEDLNARYKVGNVILAAPDINVEILMQRVGAERLGGTMDRVTIYSSKGDKAIGAAVALMGDSVRLGGLTKKDAPEHMRNLARAVNNVDIVSYTGNRAGSFGHSYYRLAPAVSSDFMLTVLFDRSPGAENGRPLTHKGATFWEIDDDYLKRPR